MKDHVRLLAVGISTFAALEISSYLVALGMPASAAVAVTTAVAATLFKLLEYLMITLPYQYPGSRRLLEPLAQFEGFWIQTLDGQPGFGTYVVIEYITATNQLVISGMSFNAEGHCFADWASSKLNVDLVKAEIVYFYQADMRDGTNRIVDGYGFTRFQKGMSGLYTTGTGYFVDSRSASAQSEYTVDRITTDTVRKLLGLDQIRTHNDIRNIVAAYTQTQRRPVVAAPGEPAAAR